MVVHHPTETRLRMVLDTNVSLDWLAFHDPGVAPLAQALAGGQAQLLTCAAMRDELKHMLGHASLARWRVDVDRALALHDRHACVLPAPQPCVAPGFKCTDPDDQVFIDLAMAHRATLLLTHDRALLKLARRARTRGVQVLRPRDWPGLHFSLDRTPADPPKCPSDR